MRLCTWPLQAWMGVGPQFFLQCLAGLEQLLSRNVFLGCPFSSLLARKSRLLLLLLFLSVPIDIHMLPASSALNLGYMRPKENPGTSPSSCRSGPKFLIQLLDFAFQMHLMSVLCTTPCVFSCAYRVVWGEKICISSSQKWKFSLLLFLCFFVELLRT